MPKEEHILVVDLGSSKVCAVVARVLHGDELEVVGVGTHRSTGIQNGAVIDLERTTRSIESAAQKALAAAGVNLGRAWVGITTGSLQSSNGQGRVAVLQGKRGITKADMDRAVQAAVDLKIPPEMQVLHMIPRSYRVDDISGVRDPEGMLGGLLEVEVHIVCAKRTDIQNIERAVLAAGFKVEGLLVPALASALSVLSEEEMKAGVAMVDIGGGTTDIAVYKEGQILHTKTIQIGGERITGDIAACFAAPKEHAEALKKTFGSALTQPGDDGETIEIQRIRPRQPAHVSRAKLNFVIEARAEQIAEQVAHSIEEVLPREEIVAGIVLTGGCSLLSDIREKFQNQTGIETSSGIPGGVTGFTDVVKSPTCAAAIGMLQYALRERRKNGASGKGWKWLWNVLAAILVKWS